LSVVFNLSVTTFLTNKRVHNMATSPVVVNPAAAEVSSTAHQSEPT